MTPERVVEIAQVLRTLSGALDSLEQAGADIPAVTRNAVRMRGTLKALEDQFAELLPGE